MIATGLMMGVLVGTASAPLKQPEFKFEPLSLYSIPQEAAKINVIIVVPAPKPQPPSGVTVKKGDNDWVIAKRVGIKPSELRRLNPGVNWERLKPGQKLKTRSAGTTAKASSSSKGKTSSTKSKTTTTARSGRKTVTVVKGENDWTIAKRAGITPSQLRNLNPKVNWKSIKPGDKIVVPGPAKPTRVATKSTSSSKSTAAKPTTAKVASISTKRARVTADGVMVRSAANTSARPVARVTKDRVASILDRKGDWYKVKFDGGTTGWIRNDLLKPVSATEASRLIAMAKRGNGSTKVASSTTRAAKPATRLASNSLVATGSLLDTARSNLGIRYRWGGTSRSGFDCSGFVGWVYARHGVKLPRTSIQQSGVGAAVGKESLKQGDLVFFKTNRGTRVNHVGIYIGGGKFIHASSGTGRVTISDLNDGYYSRRYAGGRRVTGVKGAAKIESYGDDQRVEIAAAQKRSEDEVAKAKADAEKKAIEEAAKKAEEKPSRVTPGADVIGK